MTTTQPRRFDPATLADLDEPVRRYFLHALAPGAVLARRVRLRMRGRVKVGAWLRFEAEWDGDARSLSWRAVAGPGRLRLLRVHDRFAAGIGSMDIRARRPAALRVLHVENEDVARSGAGRAALEGLWVPAALLPEDGVDWRTRSDEVVIATWDVPPERPEVRVRIGPDGGVRSYSAPRWRSRKAGYVPFGADVHAERGFAGITIPSRITAGWGHGTPAWNPFFEAEILAADPLG